MKAIIKLNLGKIQKTITVEIDKDSDIKIYTDPSEPERYQQITFNIVKRYLNGELVDMADAYIGSGKNEPEPSKHDRMAHLLSVIKR